jgi:hypothetical protein
VGLDSLYRRAQGGALYCFCSARCLDLFALDPTRFTSRVDTWVPGDARGSLERAAPDPAPASVAPTTRPASIAPTSRPASIGPGTRPASIAPSTRPDTFPTITETTPEHARPATGAAFVGGAGILQSAGWLDLFAGLFPWRERRFARRVSRELLKLYRVISASQPGLRGKDLYRRIVMARSRFDAESADTLINQAEESFAAWPVPRELKFCDVVHFIAVSEFLASHGNSPWIHANVGRVVASQIPHNL